VAVGFIGSLLARLLDGGMVAPLRVIGHVTPRPPFDGRARPETRRRPSARHCAKCDARELVPTVGHEALQLGQAFELEFEEGELGLTAGSGEEMWRLFTGYDGMAKAHVDSLPRPRAQEYRRAFIAYHERHRANGHISLPRRYLLTLGRRRRGSPKSEMNISGLKSDSPPTVGIR
jgi:hypothetical protein